MNTTNEDTNKYNDIIDLPHHVSIVRSHMTVHDRAAQFAPFAALTGHDAVIAETARLTDEKYELDDTAKAMLDEKLRYLLERPDKNSVAIFTYFVPDKKKAGGVYNTVTSSIKKIDEIERLITLNDGTVFPVEDLYSIDGEMFDTDRWF